MLVERLEITGYRSLRDLGVDLGDLTVVVGPNGCGKTNLYRGLKLLHAAATGTLARTLAEEGGMPSVTWAGPRKKGPVRVTVAAVLDGFRYEMALGLPIPALTVFALDPVVKEETLAFRDRKRWVTLSQRAGSSVTVRNAEGRPESFAFELDSAESVLAQLSEPHRYPELSRMRSELGAWRFYHHFRTDEGAAARRAQVGVRTPVLAHDGADLAAALQTVREIGDPRALDRAIARGFPGSRLHVDESQGRFEVKLEMPGLLRPLAASELSDGTLRYLCLVAALLSPRPAPFVAFNEPETSLHPDLYEPLAALLIEASARSRVLVTTHAAALTAALTRRARVVRLARDADGETVVESEA